MGEEVRVFSYPGAAVVADLVRSVPGLGLCGALGGVALVDGSPVLALFFVCSRRPVVSVAGGAGLFTLARVLAVGRDGNSHLTCGAGLSLARTERVAVALLGGVSPSPRGARYFGFEPVFSSPRAETGAGFAL